MHNFKHFVMEKLFHTCLHKLQQDKKINKITYIENCDKNKVYLHDKKLKGKKEEVRPPLPKSSSFAQHHKKRGCIS